MLDERKLKILYAIIDSYITTSEPIGSRTISKQYDMGISSATVRNEMSDLEDLGFLNKAYSSSGRIPSEKAYRHYVDYLLSLHSNDGGEIYQLDILDKYENEKDKMFKQSAKVITELTDYITATMVTEYLNCILKSVDLVNIGNNLYVLVLVFDSGRVINNVFNSKFDLDEKVFDEVLYYLRTYLIGVQVSDLVFKLEELRRAFVNKLPFITNIANIINEEIRNFQKADIELEGISNIFNFPEYQDIQKAKEFINFLENRDELKEVFLNCDSEKLCVRIGSENHKDFLQGNTIVASSFDLGKSVKGNIAVIGPTRMDYEKIIKIMYNFDLHLNNRFR